MPDNRPSTEPPPRGQLPTVAQVRQLAVFEGASDEQIQDIINAGTYVQIPADWSLIWENTPGDKAYLVLSGDLAVRSGGEDLGRLGAGDFIGEMAIIQHKLRSASVIATTLVTGLHFTADAVNELRETSEPFRAAVEAANEAHSE